MLGEDYTLRIDGASIKSTQGGFSTALTCAPDENGLSFQPVSYTHLYAKLDAAEQQVEAGQTLDARSALQELRARYGI